MNQITMLLIVQNNILLWVFKERKCIENFTWFLKFGDQPISRMRVIRTKIASEIFFNIL